MSQMKEPLQISPAVFETMVNLVFIRFGMSSSLTSNMLLLPTQKLTYLPDVLRYLRWDDCPLKSFPSTFNPKNLIELRLCNSNIKQLWNGDKDVVNLRVINLERCIKLSKIPSLLGASKLEKLYCPWCRSLVELPDMKHLKSLKILDLTYCPIRKFPEIATCGALLEVLNLSNTLIAEVPPFIRTLRKLRKLNMSGTYIQNIPSSIVELDALEEINLNYCSDLAEVTVPGGFQKSLTKLHVTDCKSLKSISELQPGSCKGEQLIYVFRKNMVHADQHYREASFDFRDRKNGSKMEKCGVHVFYVDMENKCSIVDPSSHHSMPRSMNEDGTNVEDGRPATIVSRLDSKRSFTSDEDVRDHEPNKRVKLF